MGAGVNRRVRGARHRPGRDQCHALCRCDVGLLIVFMVTAPLLTVGVEVELPKTEAVRSMQMPHL